MFQGDATGEPMDEPNETQLHGWLRSRGLSDEEVRALIEKVDDEGITSVEFGGGLLPTIANCPTTPFRFTFSYRYVTTMIQKTGFS